MIRNVIYSEVTELNGKVQFSSKVHFFGELELNLVHFLANWTWTELSSLFGWTWTKMNWKIQFILKLFNIAIFNELFLYFTIFFSEIKFLIVFCFLLSCKQFQILAHPFYYQLFSVFELLWWNLEKKCFKSELKNELSSLFGELWTELSSLFCQMNLNWT